MDIFGPLRKTKLGNKLIAVKRERYSKLTNETPTAPTTAAAVATIFVDHCISNPGIPETILTVVSPQFISKFFRAVCVEIHITPLTTTEYYMQTNGQVDSYNATISSQLRHYVDEEKQDCHSYVRPLTYSYNVQVHRFAKLIPFSFVLSLHPTGSTSTETATISTDFENIDSPLAMCMRLIHCTALL